MDLCYKINLGKDYHQEVSDFLQVLFSKCHQISFQYDSQLWLRIVSVPSSDDLNRITWQVNE